MGTEILPDDRALRHGRRDRALAQMQAHDLDILVLGRQANARYVAGAPQLWVAGTRPFGPVATVVRESGSVHLLSTWDEGVPEDIPHDNLYGIAWNPMNTIAALQSIAGASTARRVGTDALSPTFAKLLPLAFPNAEFVDGELAMRAARRIKTAEEVSTLRGALGIAEAGVAAAVARLAPGVPEQTLIGILLEAMAAGGVSTPASQDSVWVTSRTHPWRRAGEDRRAQSGDLVAFSAGVLGDGYIGEVGRTWQVGEGTDAARAVYRRRDELWSRLVDACKPGAATSDLLAAYENSGVALPPMPVARGLGMGFDPPVVSPLLPETAAAERLEPGMVLGVTAYVWEEGVGAVFSRDAVLITDDGHEVLTSAPHWPH
ncbi:M24 family metallopeptidase [Nocardia bovistercoris]|uniref:Aminopeptidase P family protein n=1 Tax=Nocardia bovistercoris TaxID=2785916 RepID=A0A931N771_9NOCA|nr:M24 family metallopeptidase [Nocardia bovistercoris]MBH0781759.1 aminopeptidase P family protein [Nocardia bovistercoris]